MRIQFVEGTRVVTKRKPKGMPSGLRIAGMLLAIPLITSTPAVATEKVYRIPLPAIQNVEPPVSCVKEGAPFVNEGCATQKAKHTTEKRMEEEPSEAKTEQSVSVSAPTASLVNQKIASLPEAIQTELQDYGWTFQTVPRATLNSMGYGSVMALTDYVTKTVYFRDQSSAIEESFYHELGHVLASNRRRCDLSVEFAQCYESEKDSLIDVHEQGDKHCSVNQEEFFATIVDDIFSSGDLYADSAPSGFAFVHERIGI